MPIPVRLSTSLHAALGDSAGADMVTWMHSADTQREMAELEIQRFEAKMDAQRHEFRADLAEFKHQVHVDVSELRDEMRAGDAALRDEMRVGVAALELKIAQNTAGLAQNTTAIAQFPNMINESKLSMLRWMVGLWIAAIIAMWLSRS